MGCGAAVQVQPVADSTDEPSKYSTDAQHNASTSSTDVPVGLSPQNDLQRSLDTDDTDTTAADPKDPMDLTLESANSVRVPGELKQCTIVEASKVPLRILLIRHAQSAKKEDGTLDPDLSNLGVQQTQRLQHWLRYELENEAPNGVFIVSSPMRNCLSTILPAVQALELPRTSCICHGAAFDFACAGVDTLGLAANNIEAELPFHCVGFGTQGWDYRGCSTVETGPELLLRVHRLIAWLEEVAFDFPVHHCSGVERPVMLLCTHEVIIDLLIRIVVDREIIHSYDGKVKYKVKPSYLTELSRNSSGAITVVRQNSGDHLRFAVQPLIA